MEVDNYLQNSDANDLVPATLILNDQVLSGFITQYTQLELERLKLSRSMQPENSTLCRQVISLPMHTELTDTELQYITKTIKTYFI